MATRHISNFSQQFRRAVLGRNGAGLTDGQLLTLFVEQRDELFRSVRIVVADRNRRDNYLDVLVQLEEK